jgi:peptidoglycan hydrolase CwlO-like protein
MMRREDFKKDVDNSLKVMQENMGKQLESLKELQKNTTKQMKEMNKTIQDLKMKIEK